MKPPKCKSCGAEEWRHTCGVKLNLPKLAILKAEAVGSSPTLNDVASADGGQTAPSVRNADAGKRARARGKRSQEAAGGTDVAVAQEVERGQLITPSSSKGRTSDFGSENVGSIPTEGTSFDRLAYQREYMRRYRAKKAGKV